MRQILSDPRAREKPCLRCGRSLLKHLDDRHCPDCGLSVWISLNPNDSLEWSRPKWLSIAAKGAWVLSATQLIALLAYFCAMGGYVVSEFGNLTSGADFAALSVADGSVASTNPTTHPAEPTFDFAAYYAQKSIPVAIGALLIGIYFIANSVGLWLISADEKRYPDRTRTTRLAARIVCGVSIAFGSVMIALPILFHGGWPIHRLESWGVLILCELTFAAAACCAWLILQRVARRAGKGPLAKLCGYLLFLPAVAFAKAVPFGAICLFSLIRPFLDLLPLLYIPLSVYLFIRFALLLQRAVPEAEKAWASETKKDHVSPLKAS